MHLDAIEQELDRLADQHATTGTAAEQVAEHARLLLALAEDVLAQWVIARGEVPTDECREGFRLLGLHRQGAKGDPSFNACRETCREVAYHYNLLTQSGGERPACEVRPEMMMMTMLVRHLNLFVSGKLQESGLGDFCCASRPLRSSETTQELA